MAGWMINCKEYAKLTSQSMDHRLSLWDWASIKIHQMICPPCNLIRKQFDVLRNACRQMPSDETSPDMDGRLSNDACERIKAVLEDAADTKP